MFINNVKKQSKHFLQLALPICSGTGVAQLVALLSILLICRIYNPQQFGQYSIIIALAGFLGPLACLSFENAIIINNKKFYSQTIFLLCIGLSFIFGATIVAILAIIEWCTVFDYSSFKYACQYKFYTGCYVFVYGIYSAITALNFKMHRNRQIGYAKALEPLAHHSFAIILGLLGFGVKGLLAASIAGLIMGLMILMYSVNKELNYKQLQFINFRKLKLILFKFSQLPKFHFFTNILINLNFTVLILVFSFIYNDYEIGLLAFTLRILRTPYFITKPLSSLFLNVISKTKILSEAISIYSNLLFKLVSLGIMAIILTMFIPYDLIVWIFGDKWNGITKLMQICVFFVVFELIQNILSGVYLRINKQHIQLILCSLHTAFLVISVIYIVKTDNVTFTQSLIIISAINTFMILTQLIAPKYLIKQ